MTAADAILAALVLGGALLLLGRSLRRTAGGCHGCSRGCRTEPTREVVRLGLPPRPGSPGGLEPGRFPDTNSTRGGTP